MDEQVADRPGSDPEGPELQRRGLGSLIEFEGQSEARRLERLTADQNLITTLELGGFKGRDWEVFADALARYGYQVMRSWIASGKVFVECKKKGWGGADMATPPDGFGREDVEDLTEDTVAIAILKFRETVLMAHRWRPDGGASLKTFFIGQCLLRFPKRYRQWANAQRAQRRLSAAMRDATRTAPSSNRDGWTLQDIDDPIVREIVRLKLDGYDQDEIGEALGMSVGAIESRLYRYRHKRTA